MDKLMELELEEVENMVLERERFKIDSLESANWALRKLKAIEDKKKETEMLAKIEIERINEWKNAELSGLDGSKDFFDFLLTEYYTEQKALDPKFKLSTPYGKVTSRKLQDKWNYEDEQIIEGLRIFKETDLLEAKVVESVNKNNLKKSVEIKHNIITHFGVVCEDIRVLDGTNESDYRFVNIETGEIANPKNSYKYHDKAIVYKGMVLEGIKVEPQEDSITIKVAE